MKLLLSTAILAVSIHLINALEGTCDAVGTFCSNDCKDILLCTKVGTTPKNIAHCDKNNAQGFDYCKENGNEATCSSTTPECSPYSRQVICGGFGEMPHPFNCNMTILCEEADQPPARTCHCSPEFSVNSSIVGLPCVKTAACPSAAIPVNCTGKVGVMTRITSTNFCYICKDTEILVFECVATSANLFYDGPVLKDKTCPQTSTSATSSTTSNPDDNTPPSDNKCNDPGAVYADPTDCNSYYICNSGLNLEHRQCPANTHFNLDTKSCISGDC